MYSEILGARGCPENNYYDVRMYGVLLVYGLVVFMMGGACIVDVCSTADMFLFGLTGGIASGKSTVAAVLSDLGCSIVDADIIAREGEVRRVSLWCRQGVGTQLTHETM